MDEDGLLKFIRLVRVFGWTAGSLSLQSVLRVHVSPSFVILHSSNAQSRFRPSTRVSLDMDVRTGKNVSALERCRYRRHENLAKRNLHSQGKDAYV